MMKLYYYDGETQEKKYTGMKAFTQTGIEKKISDDFYWKLEEKGIHLIIMKGKKEEIWI